MTEFFRCKNGIKVLTGGLLLLKTLAKISLAKISQHSIERSWNFPKHISANLGVPVGYKTNISSVYLILLFRFFYLHSGQVQNYGRYMIISANEKKFYLPTCRCSSAFFEEERSALKQKRQKIRLLQQRKVADISQFKDLPEEIPLPLVIGTKVTGIFFLCKWN